jgi:hypothetical protein
MRKLSKIVLGVFLILTFSLVCLSFNVLADTASGTVSVQNTVPTMGTATLFNQADADAAITLSAGGTVVVTASATVTDVNGGASVSNASATLYHSTSTSGGADDENIHITNSSCVLGTPSENDVVATCKFTMNFMALDGTWTANITAVDSESAKISGTDDNTANTLVGLNVVEATIDFSSLELGANSSSATAMTVRSQGNVVIDAQYSGTNYTCDVGTINAANTRYGLTDVSYDELTTDLTEEDATQTGFNLGIRGVATANGANSDESEYWGIKVPTSGVSGTCTNTLTVTAIADA